MNQTRIGSVLPYLPREIRSRVERAAIGDWLEVEEIRLRANAPLTLCIWGESCFLTPAGGITNHEYDAYRVSQEEVQSAFAAICENSVYAHMEELRQGFLTLKGGHRVGICGKAAVEAGRIKTFREVSSLNFRIARQVLGVADQVVEQVVRGTEVNSTLIISPPQTGKTTLLRDLIRQVSNRGFKVGVADDRGELAAMYGGAPQNDLGAQTDVIDGAPKAQAMLLLLRTMSPRVLVSDEIASPEDVAAIRLAHGAGVAIVATTHGEGLEEVRQRKLLEPLFQERVFRQAALLRRDFSTAEPAVSTQLVAL